MPHSTGRSKGGRGYIRMGMIPMSLAGYKYRSCPVGHNRRQRTDANTILSTVNTIQETDNPLVPSVSIALGALVGLILGLLFR